ncbi:hypothetical protein F5887DRAFT_1068731 [Amanita rubescens]|nr:hypothetical protein F5887DRAFT_1068731 [Amanita rubescens]
MSDSTKRPPPIALPPVPDDLKGRRAVFGYLIDDAVQRNYYRELEIEEDMTPEDYRNKYEKYTIVRDAARMAKCPTGIMWMRRTLSGEKPVFASFASYNPPFIATGLPTVDALAEFKRHLSLDADPYWYGH